MTSSYRASSAAIAILTLLPLLPVRLTRHGSSDRPPHDTPSSARAANSDAARRAPAAAEETEQRVDCSNPHGPESALDLPFGRSVLTLAAAQQRWDDLLQRAAGSVLEERLTDAVQWLQRANSMKNRWEAAAKTFLTVKPDHWITLSACSMAAGDDDTAAAFAIHGWQAAGCHWIDDLQHDFRSSRADAATLLALNRLHQRRPDRAANLITCAIEGHRQVGDLEQLAADFLVLSLCLDATADASGAADARQSAARIVKESLDLTRHHRGARLAAWLQRFGSARPLLMKNG